MKRMIFIDTEVSIKEDKIEDFGGLKDNDDWIHTKRIGEFLRFIKGADYLVGHNIIHHDLVFIEKETKKKYYDKAIDTLYLSPLLFPKKPYHNLVKDDKLREEDDNNPLLDARKAKNLFEDEINAFTKLPDELKTIYFNLLGNQLEFKNFFNYIKYAKKITDLGQIIINFFHEKICHHAPLDDMIKHNPVELAYALAIINVDDDESLTPAWVIRQYPIVSNVLHKLRNVPCVSGCPFCNERLDIHKALKTYFGYDSFRTFDGKPLQEQAVQKAVENKSLLVVFPTGGGKSLTFQLPALMAARNTKGLTVVISPLQSLMKDQVDNLEQRSITQAVTINGMLDPIERKEAIRRLFEGEAHILYISPEALRSKTIEKILCCRNISRIVIDEAHCFSAWGQDFRVDYLYIAEFIKRIKELKNLAEDIPISCFTATAKPNVIDDIVNYFSDNLQIELETLTTSSRRDNLQYRVIKTSREEKYKHLRNLLDSKKCPTIVYVSRTSTAEQVALRLNQDGYRARYFHGQMENYDKTETQDIFMRGDIDIIVATSAFGMGVDKKDVGMVIHYDISDSLENYLQEAGRAGRDQSILADCFILFDENDLNKHFYLLNQTKVTQQEIQQIWKAIKDLTKVHSQISISALELAREAGWNDQITDITNRVTTAVAALEDAGFVKRGQNSPRVFATSITVKNMIEARKKIEASNLFIVEEEKTAAIRIMHYLIGSRSRKEALKEEPDSRIDYIADNLGYDRQLVIKIIQRLREADVLADDKDIKVYFNDLHTPHKAKEILSNFEKLEKFLLDYLTEHRNVINLKSLNELALEAGVTHSSVKNIRRLLNFWAIKKYTKQEPARYSPNYLRVTFLKDKDTLLPEITKRLEIAHIIIEYLEDEQKLNDNKITFSLLDIMKEYERRMSLYNLATVTSCTSDEVENAILYLSRIGSLKVEGGFLVIYNPLSLVRVEKDNKIRYKLEHYRKLQRHYEQKKQMIHIVGEYAKLLLEDYQAALNFVDDYFTLEFTSFVRKYFRNEQAESLNRNMTPGKFNQLFGSLSPEQLKVITDKDSQYIVVAAGPGSGKTKVLVHKLASLLYLEDIKHEQLLMLTFSRASATEFKKRLIDLIGTSAHYVEIKTFHSYCFDLLGKVGNIDNGTETIKEACQRILNDEVEPSRITKAVFVIDEAQDMNEEEFQLVQALINKNESMRVIAVGDDDQNIFGFRGSSSLYMQELLKYENSQKYELVRNFRSKANLVEFSNIFVQTINNRLKMTPIYANQSDNGKINIIRYKSEIIVPAIMRHIEEGFTESTCILTQKNNEALQVLGILLKNGIQCKLIRSHERYPLINLQEVRFFLEELRRLNPNPKIDFNDWKEAKRKLKVNFFDSDNYDLCCQIIKDFEVVNGKDMYYSDLEMFIKESKEADFYQRNQGQVIISTIHKAKGLEFDHVILILNSFNINDDEEKRKLYVGLTRAKNRLSIHYNGNYIDKNRYPEYKDIQNLRYEYDNNDYSPSDFILFQLGLDDINLSSVFYTQELIKKYKSGNSLIVDVNGILDNETNKYICKYSKKFKTDMEKAIQLGYSSAKAKVKNIVYWRNPDDNIEYLVILPEIELTKEFTTS